MDKPGTFTPARRGQVVIPISPAALQGLAPDEIADKLAPMVIEVAASQGGAPIGNPELLKADELLSRTDDPGIRACVDDAAIGSLFIVAEMIPKAQADEIARRRRAGRHDSGLIVVSRPVIPRRRGPRR